jgi:hypothetical protein
VPDRPSVGAAAQNYEDSNPAQAQERTTQLLGSYMGVLRNMTGLGSGGVSKCRSIARRFAAGAIS